MQPYATLCRNGGSCGGTFVSVDAHHGGDGTLVIVRGHMRITHGHLDVGVAKVARHDSEGHTIHDPAGGGGMAQIVEVEINQFGVLDATREPVIALSERRFVILKLAAEWRPHQLSVSQGVVCIQCQRSQRDVAESG